MKTADFISVSSNDRVASVQALFCLGMAQIEKTDCILPVSAKSLSAARYWQALYVRVRRIDDASHRSRAATLLDVATPPASLNRDAEKYLKLEKLKMTKINLDCFPDCAWHFQYSPAPRHSALPDWIIRIIDPINNREMIAMLPDPAPNHRLLAVILGRVPVPNPFCQCGHDHPFQM